MTEKSEHTDLLGDPIRHLPDKRGRRKLRFAVEVYEKVEVLAATGMLQDDIADAVGISAPTLRKYFRPELDKAEARQRARVLTMLATQADKGNVSAGKAYLAEIDKRTAAAAYRRDRSKPAQPAAAPQEGKKAAARAVARAVIAAGDKFAPRGARLATVNGEPVEIED